MNLELNTTNNRCRICLQYSTETISVHAQADAGVSYLDIALMFTNQLLKLEASRNELVHICVSCANMARAAYSFKSLCEGADHQLECNEGIFKQETEEDVKNDESISNYKDYRDSYLKPTDDDNHVEVFNQTENEPVNAKTWKPLNLEFVNPSSDLETLMKTENNTENCFAVSLNEGTIIVNENQQMLNVENNTIEESLEIYYCKLCNETFNHYPTFRSHSRIVHRLDKLPCFYCEYVPKSPTDYAKHSETEHADKKTICCNRCDKTFFEIRALKLHLLVHSDTENFVCEVCGSKFVLKSRLIKHLRGHEQRERSKKNKNGQVAQKSHACKICDAKFTQLSSLRRHNKDVHNLHDRSCYFCDYLPKSPNDLTNHIALKHADQKSWACPCKDCGKTFLDLRALKLHLNTHKGIQNHICHVCGDKFVSKFMLMEHMRRHTAEKLFSCSKCDRKFRYSSNLSRHMATHDEDKSLSRHETLEIYVCKLCNKKFKQRASLRKHNIKIHNITERSCYFCEYVPKSQNDLAKHTDNEHADKKTVICDLCGKTFFEIGDLTLHMHFHNGYSECQICNRKFSLKSSLLKHIKAHGEENPLREFTRNSAWKKYKGIQDCKIFDERIINVIKAKRTPEIYICKVCNTKFKQRSTFRKHYKNLHGIHKMSCYYCDYLPEAPGDLAKHTAKEHAGEKKFACDQCDKAFFTIRTLKIHLLVHYGIKNFECKICNNKFITKFNLTAHMRKHTGEKPFQCSDCGKTFKTQYSLKYHIANQTCKEARELNPKVRKKDIDKAAAKEAPRIYGCKVCDGRFTKGSALRRHTKAVHKINQNACFFCDYVPESTRDLRMHTEKEHADKKTIICEHCNKAFFDIYNLKVHSVIHNSIKT